MPLSERDAGYLWDMLNAAQAVQRFIGELTREQYLTNEVLQAAVERKIEIIGEAARHVSVELQASHAEIPWSKIMGQRHVLAHDYGQIEHDRIWTVITIHLPELVAQLKPLIPDPETLV